MSETTKQPKAFYILFSLELWERFGYYGLQAVLASFFVKSLGMSDAESFIVFGAFSAMVYGYVSIGGYIGDKILGAQRTVLLGAVTLMLGYVMMALAKTNLELIFLALGCIAVGNGLFKANPSSLLAKLYKENDPRLDSAFTLYYMSVNIGSFFSMLLVPILGGKYGLHVGFYICAIGLILALASFAFFRYMLKGVDSPAGLKPMHKGKFLAVLAGTVAAVFLSAWLLTNVDIAQLLMVVIGVVVFSVFIKLIIQSKGAERRKMVAALILIIEAIIFFTLYQQMPTSLNFFAIKNVDPNLLGMTVSDPEAFQSLNPFWIMLASPILAYMYTHFGQKGRDLSMPGKFAVGMCMCAVSFLLLSFSAGFSNEKGLVSAWWLVGSYFFQSVGELLISGLGLSMISKLVPQRLTGFLMGAWFLTTAIAAFTGAWVAKLTAVPKDVVDPLVTLSVYGDVFFKIGVATTVVAVVMIVTVPVLRRLIEQAD